MHESDKPRRLVNSVKDIENILKDIEPKDDDGLFTTRRLKSRMAAETASGIEALIDHWLDTYSTGYEQLMRLPETVEKAARGVLASEDSSVGQREDAEEILRGLDGLRPYLKDRGRRELIGQAMNVGSAYMRMRIRAAAPYAKTGRKQRGTLHGNREERTRRSQGRIAELVRLWEKAHVRGVSRTHACRRVADEYTKKHGEDRISWRTVQRAVENEGKW